MNPISSASWNNTSCSTNTAATSASARGQPPEGVARVCGPYITSEISVAPTGTDNSAIRYQRTGTRQRTLRRARSATPARPDNAAVTRKAARPAPSDMKLRATAGRTARSRYHSLRSRSRSDPTRTLIFCPLEVVFPSAR